MSHYLTPAVEDLDESPSACFQGTFIFLYFRERIFCNASTRILQFSAPSSEESGSRFTSFFYRDWRLSTCCLFPSRCTHGARTPPTASDPPNLPRLSKRTKKQRKYSLSLVALCLVANILNALWYATDLHAYITRIPSIVP